MVYNLQAKQQRRRTHLCRSLKATEIASSYYSLYLYIYRFRKNGWSLTVRHCACLNKGLLVLKFGSCCYWLVLMVLKKCFVMNTELTVQFGTIIWVQYRFYAITNSVGQNIILNMLIFELVTLRIAFHVVYTVLLDH